MNLGWSCISVRHPASTNSSSRLAALMILVLVLIIKLELTRLSLTTDNGLIRNLFYDPRVQPRQESFRLGAIELRIDCLNAQEKLVARGALKARRIEHRVIRQRQPV